MPSLRNCFSAMGAMGDIFSIWDFLLNNLVFIQIELFVFSDNLEGKMINTVCLFSFF